jgi:DNA topoisomerase-3
VPTPAGLELHALLAGVARVLVDPGTTALWELKLDGILQRASAVLDAVEAIAAEAARLITVLQRQRGQALALAPGPARPGEGRQIWSQREVALAATPAQQSQQGAGEG